MSADPLNRKDRILGSLWGAVVGDALGVPVEFNSRDELRRKRVTGMRGYGSHHQPPGTWSDDSSLLLCTVESLLNGFDTKDIADRFVRWYKEGYWTPWGKVFDVGNATRDAIDRVIRGTPPEEAGGASESSNGNGSLMRILPIALRFADLPSSELVSFAHRASSITHRHPRSQMACGFYCLMVAGLVKGLDPAAAYLQAIEAARATYEKPPLSKELPHFSRIFPAKIGALGESEIQSSGYVVHTLEASLWCFLRGKTFEEAVLSVVNLGDDTDTTATVTGGLAGAYYGLEAIPGGWLDQIARREDIERLFTSFIIANFTLIYGYAAPKTRELRKNRTSVAVNEPTIRSSATDKMN